MGFSAAIDDNDVQSITNWMQTTPETTSVADFLPGPGIQKLELKFDIDELRAALDECLARESFKGGIATDTAPRPN